MKKKYIILSSILVIVVISIIFMAIIQRSKSKPQQGIMITPTPLPTIVSVTPVFITPTLLPTIATNIPNQKIQVTHIQPADASTNNPIFVTIKATFNQDITSQNITFSILPPTPFTLEKIGTIATITFSKPLQQASQYFYSFNLNNIEILPAFSLTTEGQGKIKIPDTSVNPAGRALEYQRMHDPETYLQNYSPHETSAFAFNFSFEGSHIYFTVTSKKVTKDDAKQQFFTWIQSIGLTQQQLQTLDIRYQ